MYAGPPNRPYGYQRTVIGDITVFVGNRVPIAKEGISIRLTTEDGMERIVVEGYLT